MQTKGCHSPREGTPSGAIPLAVDADTIMVDVLLALEDAHNQLGVMRQSFMFSGSALGQAQNTIKELQEGNKSACESRELAYRARNEAIITSNQHYKLLSEAQQTIEELDIALDLSISETNK